MGTDALSDVLRAVKLTGAVFFTVDVSPPWSAPVPSAATLRPIIMPSAQHLISFHLVPRRRGFDGLIVSEQGGQMLWRDEDFDAARYAGLASDEACAFQG